MTTTSFAGGRLRVSHPDSYHATVVRPRTRSLDGAGKDDVHWDVVDTLQHNGFTTVQQLRLSPTDVADRGVEAGAGTVSLTLDLAEAQDAVVLTENDGCYRWVRSHRAVDREVGPRRTATFDIALPPAAPASRGLERRRSVAVRAVVLSFTLPSPGDLAVRALETFVEPGLVHVTGTDPLQWRRCEGLDELGLDPGRTHRVLLLVHGTFDSTRGAFSALTATDAGRAFLTSVFASYDAVVGFDHRTLSVDPLANARDLGERLARFRARQPVTVDVVCHSRGGLTARSLVEWVLPGLGWRGRVDRMVFVAATNAGTHFADPSRWGDLADVHTNLVAAHARALGALPGGAVAAHLVVDAVRGIGALVRWLAAFATDPGSVPGIAAMTPDGPFVTDLNLDQSGQPRPGTPWFVVSSDFEVTAAQHPPEMSAALVAHVVDEIVDQVIRGPNDLVVDVGSMGAVDLSHGGGYIRDTLALSANPTVYHTNYFSQPVVVGALSAWLVDRVDRLPGATSPPVGGSAGPGPRRRVPPPRRVTRGRSPDGPMRAEVGSDDEVEPDGFHPSPSRAEPPPMGAEPPPAEPPPPQPPPPPPPVSGGGAGAPEADPPVQATFAAEMPRGPAVGVVSTLRVRVSRVAVAASEGTASAATVLAVRPGSPVDVQVVPTRNAVLDGPDLDVTMLPLGGGWSELSFSFHAVAPGPVRLTVLARQGRELLGRVTLDAEAVDPSAVAGGRQAVTRAQVAVASSTSPVLAEVAWLEIAQVERDGKTRFQYELRLPGVDASAPRITAVSAPIHDVDVFVSHLVREVQQLWFDHSDEPARYLADLQDLGAHLFEQLFPQDFQKVLWEHRDDLDQLFLLADEPFVPWELVHLKPPTGPRQRTPRFLGQLGLVRWPFTPFPATRELRARAGRVFSVCPEYADTSLTLDEVAAEAQFLTTSLGATTVVATEQKVTRLLRRRGGFDLLHFSGHGAADPGNIAEAKILLAGREVGGALVADYLSSTTVAENARLAGTDGVGPLVVLNACQVGRSGEELTSLGGFARAFLDAGASAFVSCLWSVNQTPARLFVEAFYRHLLEGDTVAQAALNARTAARAAGDATWLAYVVYARPDAVLTRS